ncbi:TPA_asm: RNA-directed RNA polymerase [ssRNA phage Esthiorhiza.1_5]|uniref:RNA-directed RNA polymerase n=2 Tax=Leviviricetes TaxID=2842243 RepID=A0A8S5L401_9VIRU|nr:RNA-directed RNA polymerase [ssRNA phage Esthiorhiza.1_5]QDH88318.1 MAG: RNA-dependent RNA polymerase [Leviviridae sp.]DAD51906.1 TPA_asm: RNA-directed RNA polymerase [ssRNA phage Esthiorhiza.1_5]
MKRPTMLVKALLQQAAIDLDLSVERDAATLQRRIEHEGFSFLTITLPVLSDSLEQGLECGTFTCPTSFRRNGKLPQFLGGFFQRVFDKDGRLLSDSCPECVFYIRQICRFMKKLKIRCSPKREAKAAQQFKTIEGELKHGTTALQREDLLLDRISGLVWSQVFPEIDPLDLICSHGPGATAESYGANERFRIQNWNDRSEFSFPSDLHCFPNYGLAADVGIDGKSVGLGGPRFLSVSEEIPVRVVFVPKTQTTPRVIAIEPSHVQYMQQALKDYSYKVLESHSLTRNSIRFTRQEPNQRLAYKSSIDKRLATLDLKDASDRVHLDLVCRIFKTSGILDYLLDCRSLSASLPDGSNIVLSKFASMGSAMCFPVEACVFYTLVQVAMHLVDGRHPSSQSVRLYSKRIAVYGDDIIVPVAYADAVVNYLESKLLKVNVSKSFKEGNFRESCGGDYFKGVPVNPVYARQVPYDDSRHWSAETTMAWCATANLFYLRGMWHVSQVIRDLLTSVVRTSIPRSRFPGAGLYFASFIFTTKLRWNADLQCWKQRRVVYQPTKKKDDINDDELACLNKWGIGLPRSESTRISSGRYRHSVGFSVGAAVTASSSEFSDLVQSSNPPSVARVRKGCVSSNSSTLQVLGLEAPIQGMREDALDFPLRLTEPDVAPGWDHNCDPARGYDPLDYLDGRNNGYDFGSSIKRGAFKSKRQWVTLLG